VYGSISSRNESWPPAVSMSRYVTGIPACSRWRTIRRECDEENRQSEVKLATRKRTSLAAAASVARSRANGS